jgi:hypothetical protein
VDKLIELALKSSDHNVRVIAHHVVTSREVWGELTAIEAQAEQLLTTETSEINPGGDYNYDAP